MFMLYYKNSFSSP